MSGRAQQARPARRKGTGDDGAHAAAAGPRLRSVAGVPRRIVALLAVTLLSLAGAGAYAATAFQEARTSQAAVPAVQVAAASALPAEPFVMFRNTAAGRGNGEAAFAPLTNPSGERFLSGRACDRVYATRQIVSCLATKNAVPTTFEASTYGPSLQPLQGWALGGIPSRTRISPDGALLASTVFVAGHSYASAGFSTETVIRGADGTVYGNLETFALMADGTRIKATDRNIWGVTFVPGAPNAFYATASSQGNIWLVRGDLAERTLTVVASGVECPSISPDGKRIAFKKSDSGTLVGDRHPAVLDLATGNVTVLGEQRNLDDQLEWLDGNTILYGLPRDDTGQDSDIWSLSTHAGATPELFIEHAWSPAVVR
ncbi:conserved hypothetical protein [Pseudarthrobacter chlorophenolicus A6]|uniref:WD40 domain protein beta Propeller n=1 Tax=Pseudarthrobacter chlorophenolicus (strain ATCC 700700 / DSM 12829 / CIP 107037 / JCM 12360 / KCTC 9906 / NCIMB 13794 / A6) TaxID=452863 RepID=B8HAA9_PSECP|nr:PD40 domain-containing protein [Pseudarthrobacter chlorophenolicus]ACL40201.1 conserved hypothetical protein [Pseudarthrobacter chlorophenolicus A6]SDQ85893.1 WD40-like Beta Propeller Repeat [Pseudarthrobacter chlorophenolicus]